MVEEWRAVSVDPRYEVSNLGRVRSYRRRGQRTGRYSGPRILRPGLTSVGYPSVALGRGNTHLVHRLVAVAFLGPVPEGEEVRHKDGSRDNNHATNLHYGTRQDNIEDAMRSGSWYSPGRYKRYGWA